MSRPGTQAGSRVRWHQYMRQTGPHERLPSSTPLRVGISRADRAAADGAHGLQPRARETFLPWLPPHAHATHHQLTILDLPKQSSYRRSISPSPSIAAGQPPTGEAKRAQWPRGTMTHDASLAVVTLQTHDRRGLLALLMAFASN
jgi:hypothetical protein